MAERSGFGKNRGAKNANSVLVEADVVVIKRMLVKGDSASMLARIYGVSAETIRRIGRGETWGWLTPGVSRHTEDAPVLDKETHDALGDRANDSLAKLLNLTKDKPQ